MTLGAGGAPRFHRCYGGDFLANPSWKTLVTSYLSMPRNTSASSGFCRSDIELPRQLLAKGRVSVPPFGLHVFLGTFPAFW